MKNSKGYFSEIVEQTIKKQLAHNKKILLLTHKTGYASGLFCHSCGTSIQCKQCSIAIAYHKSPNGILYGICPICKTLYERPTTCEKCGKPTLQEYGLTTQKTKEWVEDNFDTQTLLIEAKHVNSLPKIQQTLEHIKQSGIIISTHILIPSETRSLFDVVIVLAADQLLSLPDYSVRSQTFYALHRIIHQFDTKFFLIQAYDTIHPALRLACSGKEKEFLEQEMAFNQDHHYPPEGELCIIKFNNENEQTLHRAIEKLNQELNYLLQSYEYHSIEIYTSSPLIYKKFGKYYYHIILKGINVRPFMDIAFSKLKMAQRGYKLERMAPSLL